MQALGLSLDLWEGHIIASQYPVVVPWAMYATSRFSDDDEVPRTRCRFLQFYADAVFAVRSRVDEDQRAQPVRVVMAEYKTLLEENPERTPHILNDVDTMKQVMLNAWAFELQTGVRVDSCVAIFFSRRTGDDLFAAAYELNFRDPACSEACSKLRRRLLSCPGVQRKAAEPGAPMVVFDENHFGVFAGQTATEFKEMGESLPWLRLLLDPTDVPTDGSMQVDRDADALTNLFSGDDVMKRRSALYDSDAVPNPTEFLLYVREDAQRPAGVVASAPLEDEPEADAEGALFGAPPPSLRRYIKDGNEPADHAGIRSDAREAVVSACKRMLRRLLSDNPPAEDEEDDEDEDDDDEEQEQGEAAVYLRSHVNALFEHLKTQPGFEPVEFRNGAIVDPMLAKNFNIPRGAHAPRAPELYYQEGSEPAATPSWRHGPARKRLLVVLIRSLHRSLNCAAYKRHVDKGVGANRDLLARIPSDAIVRGYELSQREVCEHLFHHSNRSFWTMEALHGLGNDVAAKSQQLENIVRAWVADNL